MSLQSIEEFKVGRFTVKIHYDEDPLNPRTEYSNVATVCILHRRYALSDKEAPKDSESLSEIVKRRDIIALPIYMYDHSGITISTGGFSCPWDSGQVGYIYVEKKHAYAEWNSGKRMTRKKVEERLRSEIATYDEYLTGQVYGFVVEDEEGNDVDSCWGFYGIKYCKEEATNMAKYHEDKAIVAESTSFPVNNVFLGAK